MYSVIVFAESDEVEVVPQQWMSCEDNEWQCRWPPYRSSVRVIQAVRSVETPGTSWSTYRVRLLHTYGENRDSPDVWLGHLTCKTVPDMTYYVLVGTLNSTLLLVSDA